MPASLAALLFASSAILSRSLAAAAAAATGKQIQDADSLSHTILPDVAAAAADAAAALAWRPPCATSLLPSRLLPLHPGFPLSLQRDSLAPVFLENASRHCSPSSSRPAAPAAAAAALLPCCSRLPPLGIHLLLLFFFFFFLFSRFRLPFLRPLCSCDCFSLPLLSSSSCFRLLSRFVFLRFLFVLPSRDALPPASLPGCPSPLRYSFMHHLCLGFPLRGLLTHPRPCFHIPTDVPVQLVSMRG